MNDNTYNGWTNRATWNLVLWLNNSESRYFTMREWMAKHDDNPSALQTQIFLRDLFGETTPDGDSLDNVNFSEVTETLISDWSE